MTMDQNNQNFQQNYQKLQEIANKLAHNQEVDIDQLIPMVDEASKAYHACKERIEAVEKALSQRLEQNPESDA
ncbi:exodeoxyribonuclease VII small subunit [Thiomicrorhabdus xiamenensis]|uniref:Exodeoxyribonuclease VII small subunit n=2 Tax=Thiomicrorhabdus xiamenensis TaxID=2739063 RepID=A0A7D4SYM6_9GAMM|nr:exodeoxyribonuclease VII small subunit [Thiomicrorhabdus xiamenensis]